MTLIVLAIALPWLLVGLGGCLALQFLRQNGRVLIRLDGIDEALRDLGDELDQAGEDTPGALAPPFELPHLEGVPRSLSHWRGRRLLLVFAKPSSHFFAELAPELAALPLDGAGGRPLPIVVSSGDPEETRRLVTEHGIRCPVLVQQQMEVATAYGTSTTPSGCLIDNVRENRRQAGQHGRAFPVLLQQTWEVSKAYQSFSTPTGYLIDAQGRIAVEAGVGGEAILELLMNGHRSQGPGRPTLS